MTQQITIPENALLIKEVQPFNGLCFSTKATLQTLQQHTFDVAENLYQEAARLTLPIAGPIQWVYTGVNSDETNEFQLDIILPILESGEKPDGFSYQILPAFRCATYTYTGPWSDFGELYNLLFSKLYRDGYQNNGYLREVYAIVDRENPSDCVTNIQIGLV